MATNEYRGFEKAAKAILNAGPKAVKAAMEQEKKAREEKRKSKRASSSRA